MICLNCEKLAFSQQNKKCINCSADINYKQHVLCNSCSEQQKVCCVCIKKIFKQENLKFKSFSSKCNTCGK